MMNDAQPWRPTVEVIGFSAWFTAGAMLLLLGWQSQLPAAPFLYAAALAVVLAARRAQQTWYNWGLKASLCGRTLPIIYPDTLKKITELNPNSLWLGKGFDWKPLHTQRIYDIRKHDPDTLLPPAFFLGLRSHKIGVPSRGEIGAPYIHGVEPEEEDIMMPLSNLAGNTLVVGTTGSGKTRLFDLLISQAIFRGDVVIIIDPKGDIDLRTLAKKACARIGRPNDFVFFHPAFPSASVRLDPLKNWNRPTEIASRVAALVPSETGMDTFTAFAWLTINGIVKGLIEIDERPNLKKLRQHIQGGPESLLERVMEAYYKKHVERWEVMLKETYLSKALKEKSKNSPTASPMLLAMVAMYKTEVNKIKRSETVDALVSMFEHNREHLGKMLASLVPVLQMLTSGELGEMLSPDAANVDDERPIYDTEKIINTGKVLYIGLDSLSDTTVGSAIGSVMLADLAAVAGARYNYGVDARRISLFVDEAAEVVNPSFIQILNKARGAGFNAVFASQTVADFTAKLGNEAKARQMLGNANNLIALRTKDRTTQEFVTETFGKTAIQAYSQSQGTSASSESEFGHFGGSVSQSRSEKEVEIFPAELLGMLPNLQFMASISGGRIVKGRLPLIVERPEQ